jgi:hypothetical protein
MYILKTLMEMLNVIIVVRFFQSHKQKKNYEAQEPVYLK